MRRPLTLDQRVALEALPGWPWYARPPRTVDRNIEAIGSFYRTHGRWPTAYGKRLPGERRLGAALINLRQNYKRGKLSSERIAACESIPGWLWVVGKFTRNLDALGVFLREHGRWPRRREGRVGVFLQELRVRYKKGVLSPASISACEALPGWLWVADRYSYYDRLIKKIAAYQQKYHQYPSSKTTLGVTVYKLRWLYKSGVLSSARIAACEAIPGWVWVYSGPGCPLAEIGAFYAKYRVWPSKVGKKPGEARLGVSLRNLRARYKRGELSSERVAACEAIPGWVWTASFGPRSEAS